MRKKTVTLIALAWIFFVACGGDGGNGINTNNYVSGLITQSESSETWGGSWKSSNGINRGTLSFNITKSGASVDGSASMSGFPCMTDGNISGSSSGRNITFDITSVSGKDTINFNGTSDGFTMKGNYAVINWPCDFDNGTFTITRQ